MTERLNINATLSAVDMASPVIDRLMQNVRKLENSVKRLNDSFDSFKGIGKGSADLANPYQKLFSQMDRSVKDQITGARDYSASWRQAHDERIRSEQRLHASLSRLESEAFARRERHQAAMARQHSHAGDRSGSGHRSAIRSRGADDAFINGAAGAFIGSRFSGGALAAGAGIGLAVKEALQQRMKTDTAETKAQIFGELTKNEVTKLRSGWADKASLRFGVPIHEIISTYNEGLKAGVPKGRVAEQFTENILKAKTGLELGTDVTAKIAARIATISSGLKNSFDPAFTYRFLNAIAVVAKETAADPDEIVEANKRGMSVLTSSRMSVEDLSAFTAAGIDAGLQPGKAGTFLGFSISELINAKNARGQRSKDLDKGSRMLGFSGRGDISKQMAQSPTETLLKVYDALQAMTEENRVKAADLVFMREWRDEALANSKKADDIRKSIAAVRKSPGFIDTTSIQKLSSLQGRWDRHVAQFTLAMDRIGAGFETILIPISNVLLWIGDHLDFDLIASGVKNLLTGNVPMLMLDLIKSIFGLAWDFVKETASSVWGSITGRKDGSADKPKLQKQSFLAPAEEAAKAFKKVAFEDNGTKSSIDALRDQLRSVGTDIRLASYSGGATEFSARRRSVGSFSETGSALREAFEATPRALANSVPGNPLPAFGMGRRGIIGGSSSFVGGSSSSGGMNRSAYERMFAGTPLAGKYDQVIAAAKANGISPSLLAGVMAHESGRGKFLSGNNPGGIMDPATGWSRKMQFGDLDSGIGKTASTIAKNFQRSGGDLGRMAGIYAPNGAANDPRGLNTNWLSGVQGYMGQLAGAGGDSSGAVTTAERLLGKNEYRDTAELSKFLGRDPRGTVNAWCARFVNRSLAAAGVVGTGSDAARSFSTWGEAVQDGIAKRGDIMVKVRPDGSGHVGFATGRTKDGMIEMLSGNSSDTVRKTWEPAGRYQLRRGAGSVTGSVPSAQDLIQNVPQGGGSAGGGMVPIAMNGGAQININGGSHDPEALATLVQRRINESMNWRIHDIESEIT